MGAETNPTQSDERLSGATLPAFEPGSNVLLRGPSLSGKRALALEFLAALSADEQPVVLSADDDAENLRRRLVAAGRSHVSDRCYVVDAVRPQVTGTSLVRTDGGDRRVWYVSSPSDLTGIGISTTEALSAVCADGGRPRVVIDSISTLLQYSSLERVYRFLHVMNGRVSAVDGVTIQVMHSDAHTEREVATVAHLFDTILDVSPGPEEDVVDVRTGSSSHSVPLADVLSDLTGAEPRETPTA